MRRELFFAGLLLAASVGTASAGSPGSPYWSWSGFYIGGNAGYSWGIAHDTVSLGDATTGAVLDSNSSTFKLDGLIGGGQIGYNLQRGAWVFGIEADLQASGESGNSSFLCAGATGLPPFPAGFAGVCSSGVPTETIGALPVTNVLSERLDWFGTIRGRIGSPVAPRILPYLTGGLAFGEVHAIDTIGGTNFNIMGTPTNVSGIIDTKTTKVGWTIGGGIEDALSAHWIGRVEYLYVDLGSLSGSIVTPIVAPTGNFLSASFNSHFTDNILRVALSYKF